MPIVLGVMADWRARAKEARAIADQMTDAVAKRAMLEIAANYEEIASRLALKRAEARETGVALPSYTIRHEDHD